MIESLWDSRLAKTASDASGIVILDLGIAIPDAGIQIPDSEIVIPDLGITIPDAGILIPSRRNHDSSRIQRVPQGIFRVLRAFYRHFWVR
jgi:hypothetical protein